MSRVRTRLEALERERANTDEDGKILVLFAHELAGLDEDGLAAFYTERLGRPLRSSDHIIVFRERKDGPQ